ncbi:unnamed protein product, partial [Nesidiocoris tenuis]
WCLNYFKVYSGKTPHLIYLTINCKSNEKSGENTQKTFSNPATVLFDSTSKSPSNEARYISERTFGKTLVFLIQQPFTLFNTFTQSVLSTPSIPFTQFIAFLHQIQSLRSIHSLYPFHLFYSPQLFHPFHSLNPLEISKYCENRDMLFGAETDGAGGQSKMAPLRKPITLSEVPSPCKNLETSLKQSSRPLQKTVQNEDVPVSFELKELIGKQQNLQ